MEESKKSFWRRAPKPGLRKEPGGDSLEDSEYLLLWAEQRALAEVEGETGLSKLLKGFCLLLFPHSQNGFPFYQQGGEDGVPVQYLQDPSLPLAFSVRLTVPTLAKGSAREGICHSKQKPGGRSESRLP